ncbi:MAG: hypothetical protein JSW55_12000, partial [Chloroflexota bacterium]
MAILPGWRPPASRAANAQAGAPAGEYTFEARIGASSDDAEESIAGSVSLNSSDLELVEESSGAQTVGLRFQNVGFPDDATITSAYVQFQVDEASSGNIQLTIAGQAIDDAPTFVSSGGDISSRDTTGAEVAWSPPDWLNVGEAGADQRTPDISAIIQEVVGRSGWNSGNALALIITGSGKRVAEAYDGSSSGAPLLHVTYSSDTPPTPTPSPTPEPTTGLAQPNFRIRSDGDQALNADAGWAAGLNQAATIEAESQFRLRFEIEANGGSSFRTGFKLQWRRPAGAWADAQAFDAPSATTTEAVGIVASDQYNDGETTTNL